MLLSLLFFVVMAPCCHFQVVTILNVLQAMSQSCHGTTALQWRSPIATGQRSSTSQRRTMRRSSPVPPTAWQTLTTCLRGAMGTMVRSCQAHAFLTLCMRCRVRTWAHACDNAAEPSKGCARCVEAGVPAGCILNEGRVLYAAFIAFNACI